MTAPDPAKRFSVVRDPVLGEEVWLATTSRGLRVRVVPTNRFAEIAAMVSFDYGSIDLDFTLDERPFTSPLGVAHYLEHKLFEDESLHVFDRFASRGARVNAMTGFGRTSYYFTATSGLDANLGDLLHLVAKPHLTPENVEKERGIIAQELRMYEDNPDYVAFFTLLRGLYAEHPVRHPVGGTVESIAAIDVAELLRCHRAFYRTGNAALAVAGPVDPQRVFELAEAAPIVPGPVPERAVRTDLGAPPTATATIELPVRRPRVMVGFKERTLAPDGEARLVRDLTTRILVDRWFGLSSPLREAARRSGQIDDSLSATYLADRSFGFLVVSCETDDPQRTEAFLRTTLTTALTEAAADLEPVRRKQLGGFVRSFDHVKNLAFTQAAEAVEDIAPFRALTRMQGIDAAAVETRRRELCDPAMSSVLVVRPRAVVGGG